VSGTLFNPLSVVSPVATSRVTAAVHNPVLHKQTVPSIPSRYLSPIIDVTAEAQDGGDVVKMSRLYDDPTKLGPGSYFQTDDFDKKHVISTTWSNYRSQRGTNAVKTTLD
jgi:hypothetical protein